MEENHSSDSGSNGLIDVTNMTSSSDPASDKSSGEEKEPQHKQKVPHSAEKGWSAIGSSLNGIGFLQDEEFDCEVPDEYLDVSCESDHLNQEADQDSSRGEDTEDEGEEEEGKRKGGEDAVDGPQPKMCVWVPPECCLIPLPESPVVGSDDEGEGEQKEEEGKEKGGGVRGVVRVLSESELQRQCEKELEDLLGFKPAPPPPPPSSSSSPDLEGGDPVMEERGNRRSNSTDSGVAGISPDSMGSGVGLRHDQNGMETLGQGEVREKGEEVKVEATSEGEALDGSGGKGEEGVTPQRPLQQRPASRLKTPSEKLRKCSVFSGSPVICSELEILKEASKMAQFPLPPLPATSAHETFIVDHPIHPTHSSHSHGVPTQQNTTAPSTQDSRDCVAGDGEQGEGGGGSDSSSSTTSGCSSLGSRENEHNQKNPASKRVSRSRLSKPATRTAFAYKASTNRPPLKVKKPTLLKSLLPATGGISSASTSRLRKPDSSATQKDGEGESRLAPPGKMTAPTGKTAAPTGKMAAAPATKATGFIKPGPRMARKPSDSGPLATKDAPVASKHPPNETFTATKGAVRASRGPTKQVKATGRPNSAHPSSPAKMKSSPKLPGKMKMSAVATTPQPKKAANGSDSLSTSILSTCSPSVQQSTPMRRSSGSAIKARRGATVVKERGGGGGGGERGGGGGGERGGGRRGSGEGGDGLPDCTPKNVVGSTPNRVRPKFSFSSIESEPSCPRPVAVGETFTMPRDTQAVADSTPVSARKKRRSFIPTPVRQENNGRKHTEIPLLTYNTDKKSSSPGTANQSSTDVGCSPLAAPEQKSRMPPPKTRRPLVSRNRMVTGSWRQQGQKDNKGPLKPMNTYKYAYRSFCEDSEPPVTAAKIVHSPVNKENQQPSPHSKWSPVRRKVVSSDEACFQCTKRGFRNNL